MHSLLHHVTNRRALISRLALLPALSGAIGAAVLSISTHKITDSAARFCSRLTSKR